MILANLMCLFFLCHVYLCYYDCIIAVEEFACRLESLWLWWRGVIWNRWCGSFDDDFSPSCCLCFPLSLLVYVPLFIIPFLFFSLQCLNTVLSVLFHSFSFLVTQVGSFFGSDVIFSDPLRSPFYYKQYIVFCCHTCFYVGRFYEFCIQF